VSDTGEHTGECTEGILLVERPELDGRGSWCNPGEDCVGRVIVLEWVVSVREPENVQVAYGRVRRSCWGMNRAVEKCWCSLGCRMIRSLFFLLERVDEEWREDWMPCHSSKPLKKKVTGLV
jgi:hypothetical protein